jgi:hypothetical protein
MDLDAALKELGFSTSPNYVAVDELKFGNRKSHIFRKAITSCALQGVYFLGHQDEDKDPIVFVTEAQDREQAFAIYKSVWNQNVVPLLLVNTPQGLHLFYSFQAPFDQQPADWESVATVASTLEEVAKKLRIAHAADIDSGKIWANRTLRASPAHRVDHTLLSYLDQLVDRLHDEGVNPSLSYALIGKLLFFRYLRDRDILTSRRLREFGLDEQHSMGEFLRRADLIKLVEKTEEWLGGGVFPIDLNAIREEHIRLVATTLLGNDPRTGQKGPHFSPFEFGFIPIETLSSVYQRLLHSTALGRKLGAYYTPSSLIEFVLGEAQDAHPITTQTTVLDPSCGSGSFLVHCFRLIVERFLEERKSITPEQLKGLLKDRIFGVDRDEGACRVAQLSLLLTMLDYIEPPDLFDNPSFRLPEIFDRNIVHADFFSADSGLSTIANRKFHWVVGNPPWVQVNGERPGVEDGPALDWIRRNAKDFPIASNQVAEAFTWKSAQHCLSDGAVGLVLPAISLFKDNPKFWHALSKRFYISSVANFSSFAEVLFENATTAACVITLQPRPVSLDDETLVFSPLLLNQPEISIGSDPVAPLSITVNRSEVRAVRSSSLSTLSSAHWKAVVFSGLRDAVLLNRLEKSFPTLQEWLSHHSFEIFEGPQLRNEKSKDEKVFVRELVGKPTLVTERLRGEGRIHSIPQDALEKVSRSNAYLRVRGGQRPLQVCRPPHVIVGASLNFAAFSDQFIVVPPRQIGISGEDPALLRMLSLFLSSTLVAYQQFFSSPQGGIRGGRTTLESLRRMPCPLDAVAPAKRGKWLKLQQRRAKKIYGPTPDPEIDALVFSAFGLDARETALVQDFVHVTLPLTYGDRIGPGAQEPTRDDLLAYARFLKHSLDLHISTPGLRHHVEVIPGANYGVVRVGMSEERRPVRVISTAELPALSIYQSSENPQWIYFDRNLLVTYGDEILLFKPLQLFWWTRSRAFADSDQISSTALDADFANGPERIYEDSASRA